MATDAQLRMNHDFVSVFETLRKRFGFREMNDGALQTIAAETGHPFESLRVARHLRNAIAHDEPVNSDLLAKRLVILRNVIDPDVSDRVVSEIRSRPQPSTAIRMHAWKDENLERRMLANGFVSLGGDELGDLSSVSDLEEIRGMLTASMTDRAPTAIGLFVGYWRRFLCDVEVGDLVVLPIRDRTVAIGSFVGSYRFVDDVDAHARHRRAVSWEATGVSRDRFAPDFLKVLASMHSVQTFKAPGSVDRLLAIVDSGHDPGL